MIFCKIQNRNRKLCFPPSLSVDHKFLENFEKMDIKVEPEELPPQDFYSQDYTPKNSHLNFPLSKPWTCKKCPSAFTNFKYWAIHFRQFHSRPKDDGRHMTIFPPPPRPSLPAENNPPAPPSRPLLPTTQAPSQRPIGRNIASRRQGPASTSPSRSSESDKSPCSPVPGPSSSAFQSNQLPPKFKSSSSSRTRANHSKVSQRKSENKYLRRDPPQSARRTNLETRVTLKDDGSYMCNVCKVKFPNFEAILNHHETGIKGKPFKCCLCPQNFSQRSSSLRHMRAHLGQRRFVCTICGKEFRDSAEKTEKKVHCQKCKLSKEKAGNMKTVNTSFSVIVGSFMKIKDESAEELPAKIVQQRKRDRPQRVVRRRHSRTSVKKQLAMSPHINCSVSGGKIQYICGLCKLEFDNMIEAVSHAGSHGQSP